MQCKYQTSCGNVRNVLHRKKKKKITEKLGSGKVWLEETNKNENTIDASKRNDSIITELDTLRKL